MARLDGIGVHDRSGADRGAPPVRPGPPGLLTASPAADRPTRPRWRDPRLALGLVVVALCAVIGARLVESADDTVGVWVTRGALQAGQPVTAADLSRRETRFQGQSEADRYVSADDELPEAVTLGRPVGAGEMLPRAALRTAASAALTEVPLTLGADAAPASVRVGSTVDVWVTPERGARDEAEPSSAAGSPARAQLVFDDVSVVSAPDAGTSLGPATTRSVVVGVETGAPRRLARSIAALAEGDLLLTVQQ